MNIVGVFLFLFLLVVIGSFMRAREDNDHE
jgi:Na+-transporting methylmalonyl-CoA/oxaloacetate decarboxylase gamma subunit